MFDGDQDLVDHLGVLARAGRRPGGRSSCPCTRSSGRTASTASASPPTMIDRAAFFAPTSPPDTGASTLATPFAFAASWISRASDGSLVVMSTSTVPGLAAGQGALAARGTPRARPCGKPTMAKTTSDCSATAFGVSAQAAPASSSGLRLVLACGCRPWPRSPWSSGAGTSTGP